MCAGICKFGESLLTLWLFFWSTIAFGSGKTLNVDGTHPVTYAPSAVPNERFYVMPREVYRRDYKRV